MVTLARRCVMCNRKIGEHRKKSCKTCSVKCRVRMKRFEDSLNPSDKLGIPTGLEGLHGYTDACHPFAQGGMTLLCWDEEDWALITGESIRRSCSMTTVVRDALQIFFTMSEADVDVDHETP